MQRAKIPEEAYVMKERSPRHYMALTEARKNSLGNSPMRNPSDAKLKPNSYSAIANRKKSTQQKTPSPDVRNTPPNVTYPQIQANENRKPVHYPQELHPQYFPQNRRWPVPQEEIIYHRQYPNRLAYGEDNLNYQGIQFLDSKANIPPRNFQQNFQTNSREQIRFAREEPDHVRKEPKVRESPSKHINDNWSIDPERSSEPAMSKTISQEYLDPNSHLTAFQFSDSRIGEFSEKLRRGREDFFTYLNDQIKRVEPKNNPYLGNIDEILYQKLNTMNDENQDSKIEIEEQIRRQKETLNKFGEERERFLKTGQPVPFGKNRFRNSPKEEPHDESLASERDENEDHFNRSYPNIPRESSNFQPKEIFNPSLQNKSDEGLSSRISMNNSGKIQAKTQRLKIEELVSELEEENRRAQRELEKGHRNFNGNSDMENTPKAAQISGDFGPVDYLLRKLYQQYSEELHKKSEEVEDLKKTIAFLQKDKGKHSADLDNKVQIVIKQHTKFKEIMENETKQHIENYGLLIEEFKLYKDKIQLKFNKEVEKLITENETLNKKLEDMEELSARTVYEKNQHANEDPSLLVEKLKKELRISAQEGEEKIKKAHKERDETRQKAAEVFSQNETMLKKVDFYEKERQQLKENIKELQDTVLSYELREDQAKAHFLGTDLTNALEEQKELHINSMKTKDQEFSDFKRDSQEKEQSLLAKIKDLQETEHRLDLELSKIKESSVQEKHSLEDQIAHLQSLNQKLERATKVSPRETENTNQAYENEIKELQSQLDTARENDKKSAIQLKRLSEYLQGKEEEWTRKLARLNTENLEYQEQSEEHAKSIETLTNKYHDLEKEYNTSLARFELENKNKQKMIDDLTVQNKTLKKALADSESQIKNHESEIAETQHQGNQEQELQNQIDEIRTENELYKNKFIAAEEKLKSALDQIQELEKSNTHILQDKNKEEETSQAKLRELQSGLDEKEKLLSEKEKRIQELVTEVENLQIKTQENLRSQEQLTNNDQIIGELNHEKQTLEEQIRELQSTLGEKDAQVTKMKEENAELIVKMQSLEGNENENKNEILRLQSIVQEKTFSLEAAKEDIAKLEGEINDLKQKLEDSNQRLVKLAQSEEALKKEVDDCRKNENDIMEKMLQIQQEALLLKSQMPKDNSQELEQLKKEKEKLQKELQEQEPINEYYKNEMEKMLEQISDFSLKEQKYLQQIRDLKNGKK